MPYLRKHSGLFACLIFMVALAIQGCPDRPVVPSAPTGGVRIEVEPGDARIYVDEALVGDAGTYADRPLPLPPGDHRIKVTADGFYPEYLEVEVKGEMIPIVVSLTPVPEPLGVELE